METMDAAMSDTATADLMTRAQSGDHDAFRALTAPHVRELQVH
jgi:RNA polymerase sigma-70 factor (ECF subfamily)